MSFMIMIELIQPTLSLTILTSVHGFTVQGISKSSSSCINFLIVKLLTMIMLVQIVILQQCHNIIINIRFYDHNNIAAMIFVYNVFFVIVSTMFAAGNLYGRII